MITDTRARALRIIKEAEEQGILPTEFADLMWPDNPHHQEMYNTGRGGHKGRGLVRSAGGYLGRLYAAGLIYRMGTGTGPYRLRQVGRDALQEWEAGL